MFHNPDESMYFLQNCHVTPSLLVVRRQHLQPKHSNLVPNKKRTNKFCMFSCSQISSQKAASSCCFHAMLHESLRLLMQACKMNAKVWRRAAALISLVMYHMFHMTFRMLRFWQKSWTPMTMVQAPSGV